MVIEYTIQYRQIGFHKPLHPSVCCGTFNNDRHWQRFVSKEALSGRMVTNKKIIKEWGVGMYITAEEACKLKCCNVFVTMSFTNINGKMVYSHSYCDKCKKNFPKE